MMMLLRSTSRNSGAFTAEVKLTKVGWSGQKCGVKVSTSFGGLNAVLIIQYAGNAITIVNRMPTALAIEVPAMRRRERCRGRSCGMMVPRVARAARAGGGTSMVAISR